jgi:hypothetical protein
MIAVALATVTTASAAVILMSRQVTCAAHQEAPSQPDRHPRVQSLEARRLARASCLPFGVFTSSALLRPTMSRAWACRITRLRIRCTAAGFRATEKTSMLAWPHLARRWPNRPPTGLESVRKNLVHLRSGRRESNPHDQLGSLRTSLGSYGLPRTTGVRE